MSYAKRMLERAYVKYITEKEEREHTYDRHLKRYKKNCQSVIRELMKIITKAIENNINGTKNTTEVYWDFKTNAVNIHMDKDKSQELSNKIKKGFVENMKTDIIFETINFNKMLNEKLKIIGFELVCDDYDYIIWKCEKKLNIVLNIKEI